MPISPSRHGLSRALSKLGFCSRSTAVDLIKAGRVTVGGVVRRNPDFPTDAERDRITVDGEPVSAARKIYLMLNKPRGFVTTAKDELERETIFDLLPPDLRKSHLSAVGRLDKASEGLLLLTNDTTWGDRLLSPDSHVDKVYHVQINAVADAALLERMVKGVTDEGERLSARRVDFLRSGGKTSWVAVTLSEGKNRHIRRLLEALGCEVLRLIRVAIGSLELGSLEKGKSRALTQAEVKLVGKRG